MDYLQSHIEINSIVHKEQNERLIKNTQNKLIEYFEIKNPTIIEISNQFDPNTKVPIGAIGIIKIANINKQIEVSNTYKKLSLQYHHNTYGLVNFGYIKLSKEISLDSPIIIDLEKMRINERCFIFDINLQH